VSFQSHASPGIDSDVPEQAPPGTDASPDRRSRQPGRPREAHARPGQRGGESAADAARRRQDNRRRRIERRRAGALRKEPHDRVHDAYVRTFIGLFALTMACMITLVVYAVFT